MSTHLTVIAAAASILMIGPAIAQEITLECPKTRDSRDADTVVQKRYQITLNPPSVYMSWKRTGGNYAHDWLGENLLVETMTPYKIRAYKLPERQTSTYISPRVNIDIDRTTLAVTSSVSGSEQCALVNKAPIKKPKF